ncbi:putative two-component system-sensor histidine kinase [Tenacibaculum maritimum]|nr:putative two-component system-sensor histidine kinase [Tenacibaculum maritimum]
MKRFVLCLLVFLNFYCFSQEETKEIGFIHEVFLKKPKSYFELLRFFKKYNPKVEEINVFLEESKKRKYVVGEIFSYNFLGKHYRKKSLFEKALRNYNQALHLAKRTKNVEGEIVTLNQIGVVYRRQDKIRSALNYHQSALELAQQRKNPSEEMKRSISISQNSIGNIYLTLKQYELALEQFEKSISLHREGKQGNLRSLAINSENIGYAQEKLGYLDDALKNYQLSLKYNIQGNFTEGKIKCYNSISSILVSMKEYEKALEIIEPVLPMAMEFNDMYYLAETYKNLGYVQLNLNKIEEAKKNLKEGIRVATAYKVKTEITESYIYLSELYNKQGDYKTAFHYYKKSKEEEAQTFNERNLLYVNDLITKYDSEVKSNQIRNLARENEITKLKLTRNRNFLIIILVSLALLSVVWYSFNRQRLLKDEKKILMLEQEALQSQMNPHFIFNALNSIKLYIINNEQKNAVYYLNKFSKLIRNILESSKVKEVSLHDELKTMRLYMSIENIRFSNEITYEEKINPNLNIDIVKVPPLVLQPFLENAIWHGLSSKKGEKEVKLSVDKISNKFIEIAIADNGIGRNAAQKIKASKSLKRKSIGIDLTKKRLQNFTSEYKNNYSLKYYDLKKDGLIVGTKVCLRIPLS